MRSVLCKKAGVLMRCVLCKKARVLMRSVLCKKAMRNEAKSFMFSRKKARVL